MTLSRVKMDFLKVKCTNQMVLSALMGLTTFLNLTGAMYMNAYINVTLIKSANRVHLKKSLSGRLTAEMISIAQEVSCTP